MKSAYWQKLRYPCCQKKRLEIMQRDEFKCVDYAENKDTLNVHHIIYIYGNDPWDYPNSNFATLCECCHKCREDAKRAAAMLFSSLNGIDGFTIVQNICDLLRGEIQSTSGDMKFEKASPKEVIGLLENEQRRRWEAAP